MTRSSLLRANLQKMFGSTQVIFSSVQELFVIETEFRGPLFIGIAGVVVGVSSSNYILRFNPPVWVEIPVLVGDTDLVLMSLYAVREKNLPMQKHESLPVNGYPTFRGIGENSKRELI